MHILLGICGTLLMLGTVVWGMVVNPIRTILFVHMTQIQLGLLITYSLPYGMLSTYDKNLILILPHQLFFFSQKGNQHQLVL